MNLPIASRRETVTQLAGLFAAHRGRVAVVVLLQSIATGAGVSLPWILGQVIDALSAGTTRAWVTSMMALAFGLVVVAMGVTYLAAYQAKVLGEQIFAKLRERLIAAVTALPLSTVEAAGSGDLLGRATHDVAQVNQLVRNGMSTGLTVATTVAVTIVAAMMTNPYLGVVMLSGVPVIVWSVRWYLDRTIPAYRALVTKMATVSGLVTETMEQGESVDALGLAAVRQGRFHAVMTEMWRLDRYSAWVRVFVFMLLMVGTLMPLMLVVMAGAFLVPRGLATAGEVATVALLGYQTRGSAWQATFWIDNLLTTLVSLQRIFGVEQVEPDRTPSRRGVAGTQIEATDVTYAYRSGRPVLHGINLQLVPGERLAIVGPSGAGKSTFGRMLAGIHPPTGGSVTVDGVPLVDLHEDELRAHVVLVTQEHHVFVGSIADNVRLAKQASDESVSDAAVEAALRAVGAWGWVSALDDGLDARVGAGGHELTPAQAQQVALARIIVMNPHTVVLDEATSLIDASEARSLERGLGSLLEGRTVVAIAHRLHTAHDADRVAVMRDGQIVELGTHDDLVAANGEYAALWESWTSR